jgi:hypothetical protein
MGLLDDAIREHLDLKRRRGADPAEVEKAEREALGPVRRDGSATALSDPAAPVVEIPTARDTQPADFAFDVEPGFDDEHPTALAPVAGAVDFDGEPSAAGTAPSEYEERTFNDFGGDEVPRMKDDLDPPTGQSIAAMPPEPASKPKRRHLFHFRSHDEVPKDDFGAGGPLPDELPQDDPFAEDFEELSAEALAPEPPRETGAGEAVGRAQPIPHDDDAPAPPARPEPPSLRLMPEAELGHTVEYDVEKAFEEEDKAGEDLLEETPDFLADTPDHDRLWFEQKPPPDFDFDN